MAIGNKVETVLYWAIMLYAAGCAIGFIRLVIRFAIKIIHQGAWQ